MITIDFETDEIIGNALVTPPKPHGVAILVEGYEPYYDEINPTSLQYLENCWNSGEQLLFQNGMFDCRVAEEHLGLPMPRWDKIEELMYVLFMADPYAKSLELKPAAEKFLGMPPEEQNLLREWILRNVPGAKLSTWGAYISRAPFDLVSPYAKGDVVRTRKLFDYLRPQIPTAAYDRERRLAPVLVRSTQRGVLLDRASLEADIPMWERELDKADDLIREYLGAGPSLPIGANQEFADALERAGVVTEWKLTPKGARSLAAKNLEAVMEDKTFFNLYAHRGKISTSLKMFMRKWLTLSEYDGRLHPNWNQVRNSEGKGGGARTGRLSSSDPNFQNVPTEYDDIEFIDGLAHLPFMRRYILPDPGKVWIKRDFSSQEFRIAAHFEDGKLMRAYQENPDLDPHEDGRVFIEQNAGLALPRKHVKITGFSIIYGSGIPGLMLNLGCGRSEAYNVRGAYFQAFPGIEELGESCRQRGYQNKPITTWGGREYFTEPPRILKNGRMQSFEYKLLNYLVQGSAADQTKECINQWDETRDEDTDFLATVHDEINIQAPEENVKPAMDHLRGIMNQDLFDVPMRSEGFTGSTWHDIEVWDDGR